MTPRRVFFCLAVQQALAKQSKQHRERASVDRDSIIGYLNIPDIYYPEILRESEHTLQIIMRPVNNVASISNCLSLLIASLKHRMQIAIVSDKYSRIAGLVTLEALIETVPGKEIVDATARKVHFAGKS